MKWRNMLMGVVVSRVMATTRTAVRADGSTRHQVIWRERDTGKQTSTSFDDPASAEMLERFLNDNGQCFRLAAEATAVMHSKAPRVRDVVRAQIDGITGIESGTRARYRSLALNHIEDPLGSIPVDRLTRAQVLAWFEGLPVADKTRKNIHALLSAALETAVRERQVGENVAKGIRAPRSAVLARESVFLSKADVELLAETIDPQYSTLIRFFAATGLRFSEATALRRRDIRKDDGGRYVVHVTRAWKLGGGGWVIGGPKSPKSRRTVSVQLSLIGILDEQLGPLRNDDLVFTNASGGPLRNNQFHRLFWGPAIAALTDPGADPRLDQAPTPHDLRHTHASWLIAKGAPLPVIQARLGHETIQTTVDTYGHLANDADSHAADLLD